MDLVIASSGVSGTTAALAARSRGLKVLVVDKAEQLGGTSAWLGGVLWLLNNPLMLESGASDSDEDAFRYLDAAVGERSTLVGRACSPTPRPAGAGSVMP